MNYELTELCKLAIKYGNDRHPLSNKHSYTPVYFDLFKNKRNSIKKVLEIGVGEGAGLRMWRDFFPNALIFGADNQEERVFEADRIKVIKCDQSERPDLLSLIKRTGTDLDIVIDDASHKTQDQILTCLTLMPFLKKDVIYIIEDVSEPELVDKALIVYKHYSPQLLPMKRKYDNHLIIVKNTSKVSLIIPSRNEPLLTKMLEDTFSKASGEIEIIVVLDGPTIYPLPKKRPDLIFIEKARPEGLRPAVNDAAKIATGKYIMKSDAHVAFCPSFDAVLQSDIEDNWMSIPRRFDLNPNSWEPITDTQVDYYYLGFPFERPDFIMADMPWPTKMRERANVAIDDLMTFGGSVWFTTLSHFNKLGGMNTEGYGTFAVEQQELGLKTWLGGGRVIINKNAWYAHYGEGHTQRPYHRDMRDNVRGCIYSAHYWTENKWPKRVHDFKWLVEKFWPLPTRGHRTSRERHSWPANWRDYFEGRI